MSNNLSVSDIIDNGKKCKGFRLELRTNPVDLRKSIDLKSPGYIVKDDEVREWFFKGFAYQEKTFIFGDHFEGKTLKEILSLSTDESLPMILRLIKALVKLQIESDSVYMLQIDSVFFLDDGGILLLPSDIVSEIKDNSLDDYRTENFCPVNNPYFKDPDISLSYSIALILYRSLTGIFPFNGSSEDEINSKFRNLKVTPPGMINFELKEDISKYLCDFLNKKHSHKIEIWENLVEQWISKKITADISDEKKERIRMTAEKKNRKIEKIYNTRVFVERNMAKITTLSVAAVIIFAVFLMVLSVITKPRNTLGFTPQKVVEAYYNSYNTLDESTFRDCLEKGLEKTDSDVITYLFLMDKQTVAYERKSYFIPADKWVSDGKKEVKSPYHVYGIASLVISQEQTGDNPAFSASYEKWDTDLDSEEQGIRKVTGSKIKEKLHLKKHDKYWIICKIDRVEESKIN
jgi:hypothetical protein